MNHSLLLIEKELLPNVNVPDDALALPVVHQPVHCFGQSGVAEGTREELSQTCLLAPDHEVSLRFQEAALGQLTLQESSRCLDFSIFQTVDQSWQKLVKVEAV